MKKEAIQDIEKKYGLDKYEKTEYVARMAKEFVKYDEKLTRISNYENMLKEGKPLNKDMTDLMSKKDQFKSLLDSFKVALEIYGKSRTKGSEAPAQAAPVVEPTKDIKAEIDTKPKEFTDTTAKKLGYFFAIASTLMEKDKASSNPLMNLPALQQAELVKLFKTLTHIPEEKETTLAEEATQAAAIIANLLKPGQEADILDQIMGNNPVTGMKFRITASKVQPAKEYSTTQPISVGKDAPVEVPKKEAPAPQPVKEPVVVKEEAPAKAPVEAPKPKEEVAPNKGEEEKGGSWAEAGVGEEEEEEEGKHEEPKEAAAAPEEHKPKEDEFEIVLSKSEERKKRIEDRGRYRAAGRVRRGGFGGGRGDFRGVRRGAAPRGRGQPRAPRGGSQ